MNRILDIPLYSVFLFVASMGMFTAGAILIRGDAVFVGVLFMLWGNNVALAMRKKSGADTPAEVKK